MRPLELMSGRLLARNAMWNVIGLALPMLVGVVAIPLLIEAIGKERFGLLALIWMGVGYFSLFDMGLGRALTKLVSDRLGSGAEGEIGAIASTAMWAVCGFGVLGGLLLGWAAAPLTGLFKVDALLRQEAIGAFRILAFGLPVVVLTSALVGLLEAYQRFSIIAVLRVPLGIATFALPLLTAQFTPSLEVATAALLGMRVVSVVTYFIAAAKVQPDLLRPRLPVLAVLCSLLKVGGWITVSNLVGPLMVYFDRFLIGALLSMSAVAYYVTPYEVLSRLQTVPQSVVSVLFPALSVAVIANRERLVTLYAQGGRAVFLMMLPLVSGAFLFSTELLSLWVGRDFALEAMAVVHWLAPGLLVNAMARMPFTVLQSGGRADITAKVHLAEVLPYLCVLWVLTMQFGIAGTAAAWSLRVLVDQLVFCVLVRKLMPELARAVGHEMRLAVGAAAGFGLAWFVTDLGMRLGLFAMICAGAGWALWPMLNSIVARHGRSI